MEQRLQLFLQMEQLSQSQFADKMGIQRSGVTHLLSGRNKPSFEFITRMLQAFPALNAEWLLLGKGKPYKDSAVLPEVQIVKEPETPQADDNLFSEPVEEETIETTEIIDFDNPNQLNEIEEIKPIKQIVDTPKAIKAILILYEDGTYEKR